MSISKSIFNHVYKWVAAVASILVLTSTFVMADGPCLCNKKCCIGYVTDFIVGNVIVVDLIAGKVLQTIHTGEGATGIAYVNKERKMFVANQSGTVTVIDVDTNIARDIYTDPGSTPTGVTLGPDNQVWVSLSTKDVNGTNGEAAPGALAVFDAHHETVKLIPMDPDKPYGYPLDIQFSNDGKLVYVVLHYENNPPMGGDLVVLDRKSGKILKDISVGDGTQPTSIAPSTNGKTIYVNGSVTTRVLAIDAKTYAITEITNDHGSEKLMRTKNGKAVWSSNNATGGLLALIKAGGIDAIAPFQGSVTKIDTSTNTVKVSVPVVGAFIATMSPDERTIYSVNLNATIAEVDTEKNVIRRTYSIGTPGVTIPIEMAIVTQSVQP